MADFFFSNRQCRSDGRPQANLLRKYLNCSLDNLRVFAQSCIISLANMVGLRLTLLEMLELHDNLGNLRVIVHLQSNWSPRFRREVHHFPT